MTHPTRYPRRSSGFTLIELSVVLFIIGIATAVVGPSVFRSMGGTRLKATTRQVASMLRMARSLAVTNKAVIAVDFDLDQGTYGTRALRIYAPPRQPAGTPVPGTEGYSNFTSAQPEDEDSGQPSLTSLPGGQTVPEPLRLLSFSQSDAFQALEGQAFILFFPKGTSTGGTIQIGEPDRAASLLVTVDPVTSLVSIEEAAQW